MERKEVLAHSAKCARDKDFLSVVLAPEHLHRNWACRHILLLCLVVMGGSSKLQLGVTVIKMPMVLAMYRAAP